MALMTCSPKFEGLPPQLGQVSELSLGPAGSGGGMEDEILTSHANLTVHCPVQLLPGWHC